MNIHPFQMYRDLRSEDVWYIKYADDEIVVSRTVEGEGRNRLERREDFEVLVRGSVEGVSRPSGGGRIRFLGSTLPEDQKPLSERPVPSETELETQSKTESETSTPRSVFDI